MKERVRRDRFRREARTVRVEMYRIILSGDREWYTVQVQYGVGVTPFKRANILTRFEADRIYGLQKLAVMEGKYDKKKKKKNK